MNRFMAKAEIKNTSLNAEGILHVDFAPGDKSVHVAVSKEVKLTGIIIELKTAMFNPGLQKPVTSLFVKTDIIEENL